MLEINNRILKKALKLKANILCLDLRMYLSLNNSINFRKCVNNLY